MPRQREMLLDLQTVEIEHNPGDDEREDAGKQLGAAGAEAIRLLLQLV